MILESAVAAKQAIRAEMDTRSKNLSPVYCREADEAICRMILRSEPYQRAQNIFCFVGTNREIDTMRLIHIMIRDGKHVSVPLCLERGIMEARRIEGMGDLVSGKYGILAPKLTCGLMEPEALDLILVPCCTGNEKGQRLGHGGGYYDRYLAQAQCPTMLLCRHQVLREEIPVEEHDVKMNYLVTEKGVVRCE